MKYIMNAINSQINAKHFVADGIHQSVFDNGGRDLSFGENCRKVMNCIIYLINDLNFSSSNLECNVNIHIEKIKQFLLYFH